MKSQMITKKKSRATKVAEDSKSSKRFLLNKPVKLTDPESAHKLIVQVTEAFIRGDITDKQCKTIAYCAQTFIAGFKEQLTYSEIPKILDFGFAKALNYFYEILNNFIRVVETRTGPHQFQWILADYVEAYEKIETQEKVAKQEIRNDLKKRVGINIPDKYPNELDSLEEYAKTSIYSLPSKKRSEIINDLIMKDVINPRHLLKEKKVAQ